MKVSVVSVNEWLYPDVHEYVTATDRIDVHAPRGGYACVQLFIEGVHAGDEMVVTSLGDLPGFGCYQLLDTKVNYNTGDGWPAAVEPGVDTSAWTTRPAPFRVYDILQPFAEGGNIAEKDVVALYLSCKIEEHYRPGTYEGAVRLRVGNETVIIPAKGTVHKATLPKVHHVYTTNWYHGGNMAKRHGLKYGSEEHMDMVRKYLKLMRRTRQSHLLLPINSIKVTETEKGKYSFDFSAFTRMLRMAREEGFQHIELSHLTWKDYVRDEEYYIFYRPEGRAIGADTLEGHNFLCQFLPAWREYLVEQGIYDCSVQYIGDEPHGKMANNYRIICGLVRKYMPGMKFRDAVSIPELLGSVDYWVPLNSEYQLHRETYEHYRALGDTIWHYTCCQPNGKWLNRLLDQELLRPRLLHWGNYRYDLEGYLHWGFNFWNHDQPDVRENANAVINEGHTLLPPGDTHICYPGNANGPWMSLRAEMMRLGCEDFELLYMIAQKDKALADEICLTSMRAFDDFEKDPIAFEKNYLRLLETADAL